MFKMLNYLDCQTNTELSLPLDIYEDQEDPSVCIRFFDVTGKYVIYIQNYHIYTSVWEVKEDLLMNYSPFLYQHTILRAGDVNLLSDVRLNEIDQMVQYHLDLYTDLPFLGYPYSYDRYGEDDQCLCVRNLPPKTLTITVTKENGEEYQVTVLMIHEEIHKPLLGGYKQICTDVEYLHAYSQSGPPVPKVPPWRKNHRTTQTYFLRNRKTIQAYARATQMSNTITWIPTAHDIIKTAGPYETAAEREKRLDKIGKVKFIQRCYIAWVIRQRLKEIEEEYLKRKRLERERKLEEEREDSKRRKLGLIKKVFPLTSKDFGVLLTVLETWKVKEMHRISLNYCGPAKIVEQMALLEKELEILSAINALKLKVQKDQETQRIVESFRVIGLPLTWHSEYKMLCIEMDTLDTQKARIYYDMYRRMSQPDMDLCEKLQIYADIRDFFDHYNSQETYNILMLIDRIAIMIARNMPPIAYEGIEEQIRGLFLQVLQNDCNEGVFDRVKRLKAKNMENNLIMCSRCSKLKCREKMVFNAKTDKLTLCHVCNSKKNISGFVDLPPYKFILQQIRKYERQHHAVSSIIFILQDVDIHKIIADIWHGHSALSECKDIYELRLPRWKVDEEWSPWNCILLTKQEAKQHLKINNLKKVYDEAFFNHIHDKHALSRNLFKHMLKIEERFESLAAGNPRLDGTKEYNRFVAVNSEVKLFYQCH